MRKHFFSKPALSFDLKYIVRVVTMQNELANIYKDEGACLGRYGEIGENLWSNEFLKRKRMQLEKQQLPEGESITLNIGQMDLMNIDSLFEDKLKKICFFEHAKQGKVVDYEDVL